jgi:DNA-binding transcriptional LysR family regulator
MALSRLGLAWLPHSLIGDDLNARRLVRAGSEQFDVTLRFTLLRRPAPLAEEAERLWSYLRELMAPPARAAARDPAEAMAAS